MNQQQISISGVKDSSIICYQGLDGIREISHHSLNAKGNLYIYEMSYASLNVIFDKKEAEELRKQFLKKNIKIKEITNQIYHEYTSISGFDERCMEIRYLSPDKFNMQTEFLVYNDIVAFYSYTDEIFGVEIKNKRFAQTQLGIFKLMWDQAARPVIGKNGRSSIF